MHFKTKASVAATLVIASFAASTAFASEGHSIVTGNIENGKTIFMNGKGDVPACNSCHGQDGMGDDAMGTPRLAGQGYVFILKQLEDFATDKRMDTTMYIMNTNAKGLSASDRADVAAYVNSLSKDLVSSDMAQVKELGNPVGVRYLGKASLNTAHLIAVYRPAIHVMVTTAAVLFLSIRACPTRNTFIW
jgi:cytochrome c553